MFYAYVHKMSTSLLHSINAIFENNLETKIRNETIENKNSKYVIAIFANFNF